MATQSGITISAPNAPHLITNDIPVPSLGSKNALVKGLFTGINPSEPFMSHTGLLIESYPAVLGSDVTGVVLSTSPDCTKLHVGDYVYGCVPIGLSAYSPFQETFLVDERWIFKKADRIGLEEASTIGAGLLVSSLFLRCGPSSGD
jgi:NADPH:quinone reductase-like Zn-dependent oxidoreductase